MAAERYDAFVSYGHGDAKWVHALAGNLERLGLHVFLDAWELVAGDLIAVQLQRGLAGADAVVLVVSAASVGRGWVDEEFAAAIAGAAAAGQRLIPVVAGEVVLPPMVASRLYIDFRHADDPAVYEAKVRELADAIRGQPAQARPGPGGPVLPPLEDDGRRTSAEVKPEPRPRESQTQIFAVVDALLTLEAIADEGARREVLRLLPAEITGAIPHHAVPRVQVLAIVRTCLSYEGGLRELLEAVRVVERDSVGMRELDDTMNNAFPGYLTG